MPRHIEILADHGTIVFRPFPDGHVGQPLGVVLNDSVHWTNRTHLTITLESLDPPGISLSEPIPTDGGGSRPDFIVTADKITSAKTITYRAKTVPSKWHIIVVS